MNQRIIIDIELPQDTAFIAELLMLLASAPIETVKPEARLVMAEGDTYIQVGHL